jgi:hypothetical protein
MRPKSFSSCFSYFVLFSLVRLGVWVNRERKLGGLSVLSASWSKRLWQVCGHILVFLMFKNSVVFTVAYFPVIL